MSEPPLRVYREAVPDDIDSVRQILSESNLSIALPSARERHTQTPIGQIFTCVCQQDGKVVAVLQWRDLGEELEILDLAVAKSCRRTGIASLMLRNFLKRKATGDALHIFLEVRESNLAAIALYESFGFSVAGRRPDYYRSPVESALVMRRSAETQPPKLD